jgi:excisionase family DNA binding protein
MEVRWVNSAPRLISAAVLPLQQIQARAAVLAGPPGGSVFNGDSNPNICSYEQYLTVSEAAKIPRVSASTVRRWIRAGFLPTIRIGRCLRIPLSGLLEAIQKFRVPPKK